MPLWYHLTRHIISQIFHRRKRTNHFEELIDKFMSVFVEAERESDTRYLKWKILSLSALFTLKSLDTIPSQTILSQMFLGKVVLKICKHPYRRTPMPIKYKAILLKLHFGMGILLQTCCIFLEHLFLRTSLDGCLCLVKAHAFPKILNLMVISNCGWLGFIRLLILFFDVIFGLFSFTISSNSSFWICYCLKYTCSVAIGLNLQMMENFLYFEC